MASLSQRERPIVRQLLREFGQALKAVRPEKVTQEMAAEALRARSQKVQRTTISNWEQGRHLPPFGQLYLYASVLGLSPADADRLFSLWAHVEIAKVLSAGDPVVPA